MSETFDTLAAARRLEDAGMDRAHAEAVAAIVREGQGDLATKSDITSVPNDITTLSNKLDTLHDKMTTLLWIAGLNLAMTIAILAVMLTRTF